MRIIQRVVWVLAALASGGQGVILAAAAGPAMPPDAAALLARSLAVMDRSVRTAHTTEVTRSLAAASTGQTSPQMLSTTADCTNSGQTVAARLDQRDATGRTTHYTVLWHLTHPARIWTREGTSRITPWTRQNTIDGTFIRPYCPGSPIFLALCAVPHGAGSVCTRWEPWALPNLRDLGAERWNGHTTWHLQSVSIFTTCCFGEALSAAVETEVQDFYIDQASLRVVHSVDRFITELTDGSVLGDTLTTRTYSRFNAPVSIARPKYVAPQNP